MAWRRRPPHTALVYQKCMRVAVAGPWLVKSVWERRLHRPRRGFGHRRCGPGEDPCGDGEAPFIAGEAWSGLHRRREFTFRSWPGEDQGPPAESFDAYPRGKVRRGYRSKWEEGSFEFNHTPRSFEFPETDAPLLARLKELALKCWRLFDLRGYARVDFRVNREGRPWILEVNANPCLSPDAGFHATTLQAGLNFTEVLRRIIADRK